ncbi:DUF2844 domain-containing protein [Variovorax sp. dw_954]|uniref:DUF2844 domain-containing protein n=2 Tax=unclassified Variovorax TaxID=663243 RepID=UPI0031F6A30D
MDIFSPHRDCGSSDGRVAPIFRRFMLVSLLAMLSPLEAGATLGGTESSVGADQTHMHARREKKDGSGYSVHEITLPSATAVREFVSAASGQVFAVAWQGPFMPDLKQVLGDHFDDFVESARRVPHASGSLSVRKPELVIHSGGHMRAFSGMAYLPGQLPEGFDIEDIR